MDTAERLVTGEELHNSKKLVSCEKVVPFVAELGEDLTMIEIGVNQGLSMWYTLEKCKNIKRAFAIDPWWGTDFKYSTEVVNVGDWKIARSVLQPHIAGGGLTVLMAYSEFCADMFEDESIDYVYIDGNHTYRYCDLDIKLYYPKVKIGGIIAGHDYKGKEAGVQRAVNEFGNRINQKIEQPGGTCWYVKKETSSNGIL